jgi:hypothetical protein
MDDWHTLQGLLEHTLANFLVQALPAIGGPKWWQTHVLMQLTPHQERVVGNLLEGNVRGLDFAALLRVAKQNWSELAYKRSLPKGARSLFEELKDVRDRYAHMPVDGLSCANRLRDVDTGKRLLETLGADAFSIFLATQIYNRLLRDLASPPASFGTPPPVASEANEAVAPETNNRAQEQEAGNTQFLSDRKTYDFVFVDEIQDIVCPGVQT